MSSQTTPTVPASTDQVSSARGDLAVTIRAAHALVVGALLNTIEHALVAGANLTKAKELVGHGHFSAFLRECTISDRTARRYMQLAELAVAKSVVATDLTGLTIEGAIKRLAAPKPPIETARPAPPKLKNTKGCGSTAKLNSLLWADASIDARRNFVSAVGLDAWLEAIPAEWLPLIERRLFQQHQPPATISRQLPADLSIPQYLRRTPGTNETNTVSASEVAAQVGEPANKATDTTRRAKTPPIPIVPRPATLEARS